MYYSETSDQRERERETDREKETERKKMAKQVRFNDKVSQAVFEKSKGSKRCIDIVESCPLAEEDEVAARTSEFQLLQREQKKSLHEYHVNQRKRSRLHMRDDILEIFWSTYEEEAWKRLNDMLESPITTNDVNTFAVEAITSVNKDEIVKRWREQLMILIPVVEQHHMVPFHHRFLNTQFKEEENIQQMKERLITRAESSNHWLNELVQELAYSPDTEVLDNIQPTPDDSLTPEYNFDMISEVLSELEFNHPEIFENVPLSEEEREPDFISIETELTDDELIKSMQQYEEEMKATFDSYDYLLENEVSAFLLH